MALGAGRSFAHWQRKRPLCVSPARCPLPAPALVTPLLQAQRGGQSRPMSWRTVPQGCFSGCKRCLGSAAHGWDALLCPGLVVGVPAQHPHPPISIFAAYRKHISVGLAHTHQQVLSCRARKVLWGAGILDLLLPRSGVTCPQARHYKAVQLHFC